MRDGPARRGEDRSLRAGVGLVSSRETTLHVILERDPLRAPTLPPAGFDGR
jgi:hypothetical protein